MTNDQGLSTSVSTNSLKDVLSLKSRMRSSSDESREDSSDVELGGDSSNSKPSNEMNHPSDLLVPLTCLLDFFCLFT